MTERGGKRGGGGAPFYAPPRRKTSAEIISEARAALNGEMSTVSGSGGAGGGGGALRALPTRRPFTPREPQRTLFSERTRRKEPRPPSALDLKHLSLSENQEDMLTACLRVTDEATLDAMLEQNTRKKPVLPKQSRSMQDKSGDGLKTLPKLPHLSGRAKPLHRRNTQAEEPRSESSLLMTVSLTQPRGGHGVTSASVSDFRSSHSRKSLKEAEASPDSTPAHRRKQLAASKSQSFDTQTRIADNIGVKSINSQLPNNMSNDRTESMSILELCDRLSQRNIHVDRTLNQLDSLQRRLEVSTPASSLRELVLRALFLLIENQDVRVSVAIARALLTMRVTGKNLASALKLVFKIAKNDDNDHFFKDTNLLELLVEGCGRADPLTESECCVYGAGALRVLALEPRLCVRAHAAGAVHLAAIHLKLLNTAKSENPRSVSEQATHALFQLTGALRNLASEPRAGSEFIDSGALSELLSALQHHTDNDVLTNVARCLSILSVQEGCCAWLCSASANARALVRTLAACSARAPLTVRLAFTLGNMAAADDRARNYIYNDKSSIDVLLTILESYTKRNDHDSKAMESELDLDDSDLGGSDDSNEDVLIKTVRVLANLCMSERCGRGLAASYAGRVVRALLACLELAEKTFDDDGNFSSEEYSSLSERREELATAALATLNNMTYYREPPEPPDPLGAVLGDICKATCRWLKGRGIASYEAVRALGNLTRSQHLAQLVVLQGALNSLEPFLDLDDASVRCAAAGVLVNVCGAGADSGKSGELAARALDSAAERGDASTAALLARAVWNAHAHHPLPTVYAHQAAHALAIFIDDESVFAACQSSRSGGDRRASDPLLKSSTSKLHVTFDFDNNYEQVSSNFSKRFPRTQSVDQNLELGSSEDEGLSIEDLGFEEMEGCEECDCAPCMRLTAWEELVGVAIPLLEKLRPPKADASVGTTSDFENAEVVELLRSS